LREVYDGRDMSRLFVAAQSFFAPVRFQAGDPADFVVIDACSIRGAIAGAPRSGRLAVPSDWQTTIHWRKPT
jgi:hypothetical protein